MAARNAWIVAGIGAAAAVIVWLVMRGHGDANKSNPDRGAAASTSAGDSGGTGASSASGVTPQPHRSIPPVPIGPGTGSTPTAPTATTGTLDGDFEAEPRDDRWASGIESTLAPRLDRLAADAHVHLASVECRQRQCRVRVEAEDQDSLGTALTRLGEDGGLVGVASGMIIGTPTPMPDGRTQIDVYGTFER